MSWMMQRLLQAARRHRDVIHLVEDQHRPQRVARRATAGSPLAGCSRRNPAPALTRMAATPCRSLRSARLAPAPSCTGRDELMRVFTARRHRRNRRRRRDSRRRRPGSCAGRGDGGAAPEIGLGAELVKRIRSQRGEAVADRRGRVCLDEVVTERVDASSSARSIAA